jgi:hypothetical protein
MRIITLMEFEQSALQYQKIWFLRVLCSSTETPESLLMGRLTIILIMYPKIGESMLDV